MRWLRLSRSGGQNRPVSCLEIGYELSVFRWVVGGAGEGKRFNRSPTRGMGEVGVGGSEEEGSTQPSREQRCELRRELLCAPGTYRPTVIPSLESVAIRSSTSSLTSGVGWYLLGDHPS